MATDLTESGIECAQGDGDLVGVPQATELGDLKRHGITSAAVYATVDAGSTQICFQAAQASRLRITMGQMMMDVNSYAPKPHKNLTHCVLDESAKLCGQWHRANDGRLTYAFSPRFALSCSKTLG
jgi:cytosine/adenosine deaminase-related metal-dependent hydrolase